MTERFACAVETAPTVRGETVKTHQTFHEIDIVGTCLTAELFAFI